MALFFGREPRGAPGVSDAAKGGIAVDRDARAAPRKPVAGRVRLTTESKVKRAGRLIDLSANGFCAMLDDPLTPGVVCLVDCDVSLRGQPRVISAVARSVHSVLVSGKGYRVGFQFTSVSDGSISVVNALLA
ncbi:MAG: PilZ domain-containing protein [Rhodoferax sp.]|nr:PilZ domain-containing protein [Rhodoferax sp.]